MLSHHIRLLAYVPRWQIAPRFRTQNVAEHSYFVALYAMALLNYLPGRAFHQPAFRMRVLEAALIHDVAEARTGDMPGPVKRAVVDMERMASYEKDQLALLGIDEVEEDDDILALVKVADLIDEYYHVVGEIAMGNSLIKPQRAVTRARLEAAIAKTELPFVVLVDLDREIDEMENGVRLPGNKPETDPLTPGPLDFDDDIPF